MVVLFLFFLFFFNLRLRFTFLSRFLLFPYFFLLNLFLGFVVVADFCVVNGVVEALKARGAGEVISSKSRGPGGAGLGGL